MAFLQSVSRRLPHISKERRIICVIAIASAFLVLELVVGFITRSLALVADAFHILSDILGYVVAVVAVRYAGRTSKNGQYTYGYRRAETLGGFFNGAFLMALGVSVLLQSIERFIEPSKISNPVMVMAVGAAGIGSNVLMLLILGGHAHSHGDEGHGHAAGDAPNGSATSEHQHGTGQSVPTSGSDTASHPHDGHAHTRSRLSAKASRFSDINIFGVLIHILSDALNSVAVIISAGIYKATGFKYADPIASVFVGCMIIGTAWPLVMRAGRSLLAAAPDTIDVKGVKEDVERITGTDTVHDLHVWSVDSKTTVASLHLQHVNDSLEQFEGVAEEIRKCLHLWGIHEATIQPEPADNTRMQTHDVSQRQGTPPAPHHQGSATAYPPDVLTGTSTRCRRHCVDECQDRVI